MGWYVRLVVRHPYVLILIDIALVLLCGPVTVWKYGFPDFSDPTKGFEPRGTEIRGWGRATESILTKLYDGNGTFSFVPRPTGSSARPAIGKRRRRSSHTDTEKQSCTLAYTYILFRNPITTRKMLVTGKYDANILNAKDIRSICSITDKYIYSQWPHRSCNVISLGFYVSLLQNKPCEDITDDDVTDVLNRVTNCAPYYFSGNLTIWCGNVDGCRGLPAECTEYNAVYTILHFLTDTKFIHNGDLSKTKLRHSMIYIPDNIFHDRNDSVGQFFMDNLDGKNIEQGGVRVPAMELNIEFEVFNAYLISDLPYYALAMAFVVLVLLLYLQSFALMFAVVLNVIFTMFISYFLYFFVCRLVFFPFINIMAGLLLIAIGADDVFILYDIWRQHKREKPEAELEEVMSDTLNHGAVSILVTSLTTAAALLANIVSNITAIKCFGVFAGLCMIVMFGVVITWVPAVIVIMEKATRCCVPTDCCPKCKKCVDKMSNMSKHFWSNIMTSVVTKVWLLWIILFLALGIGGIVVVFGEPRLRLPSSQQISFFSSDHPFEQYRLTYKDQFRFEIEAGETINTNTVYMHAFWGAVGNDNGDHLDPDKRGKLNLQKFDLYQKASQEWMLSFCLSLKNQTFISPITYAYMCYMEMFKMLVEGPCVGNTFRGNNGTVINATSPLPEIDWSPCCNLRFPIEATLADNCIKLYASVSNGAYSQLLKSININRGVIGTPIFNANGDLVIFANAFRTNVRWTVVYDTMNSLYNSVRDFVLSSFKTAPEQLRNGGFAGATGVEFDFFDFQKSLADGTFIGIALALLVALIVLLITSLNLVITIYAILSITLIITMTVGVLVLLGWELNIIESLTLTLAIGLSVDFTIHYGVAYKLSSHETRQDKVRNALETVGSAVTMAALTTFLSGAAVMPGRVLTYRLFGIFLMLVMALSWLLSTLFFLALCSVIGPTGHTGDIVYWCKQCWKKCRPGGSFKIHDAVVDQTAMDKVSTNGEVPKKNDRDEHVHM